jgi:hypothetical protein
MELWFQLISGMFAFFGTMRQAVEAKGAYDRFEHDVLTPSRELMEEQWAGRDQAFPRWNIAKRGLERIKFANAFNREVLTEHDHEQLRRYGRQMWSWILLMWGALCAIAAVVWAWSF